MGINLKNGEGNSFLTLGNSAAEPIKNDVEVTVPPKTQLFAGSASVAGTGSEVSVTRALQDPSNALQPTTGNTALLSADLNRGQQSINVQSPSTSGSPVTPPTSTNPGMTGAQPVAGDLQQQVRSVPARTGDLIVQSQLLPGAVSTATTETLLNQTKAQQPSQPVRSQVITATTLPIPQSATEGQAALTAVVAPQKATVASNVASTNKTVIDAAKTTATSGTTSIKTAPASLPDGLKPAAAEFDKSIATPLKANAQPVVQSNLADARVTVENGQSKVLQTNTKISGKAGKTASGLTTEADRLTYDANTAPTATAKNGALTEDQRTDNPVSATDNLLTGSTNEAAGTAKALQQTRVSAVRVAKPDVKDDRDSGLAVRTQSKASDSTATVIEGKYGSLRVGSDGTTQYALKDNGAAVQLLDQGENVVDVFEFQVIDEVGARSTWTRLNFTVNGVEDNARFLSQNVSVSGARGNEFQPDGKAVVAGVSPTGDLTILSGQKDSRGRSLTATVSDSDKNDTQATNFSLAEVQSAMTSARVEFTGAEESSVTKNPKEVAGRFGTLTIGSDGTYKYTVNAESLAYKQLGKASGAFGSVTTAVESFQVQMKTANLAQSSEQSSVTLNFMVDGVNDRPTQFSIVKSVAAPNTNTGTAGVVHGDLTRLGGLKNGILADIDAGDSLTISKASLKIGTTVMQFGGTEINSPKFGEAYQLIVDGAYFGTITLQQSGAYAFSALAANNETRPMAAPGLLSLDFTLRDKLGLEQTATLQLERTAAVSLNKVEAVRSPEGFLLTEGVTAFGFKVVAATLGDQNLSVVNATDFRTSVIQDASGKTLGQFIMVDQDGQPAALFQPIAEYKGDITLQFAHRQQSEVFSNSQTVVLNNAPLLLNAPGPIFYIEGTSPKALFGPSATLVDGAESEIKFIRVNLVNGTISTERLEAAIKTNPVLSNLTFSTSATGQTVTLGLKGSADKDAVQPVFSKESIELALRALDAQLTSFAFVQVDFTRTQGMGTSTERVLLSDVQSVSALNGVNFLGFHPAPIDAGLHLNSSAESGSIDLNGDMEAGRIHRAESANEKQVVQFVKGDKLASNVNFATEDQALDRVEIRFSSNENAVDPDNDTEFLLLARPTLDGKASEPYKIGLHFANDQAIDDVVILGGISVAFIAQYDALNQERTLIISKSAVSDQAPATLSQQEVEAIVDALAYTGRPSDAFLTASSSKSRTFEVIAFEGADQVIAAPSRLTVKFVDQLTTTQYQPVTLTTAQFASDRANIANLRAFDDDTSSLQLTINDIEVAGAKLFNATDPFNVVLAGRTSSIDVFAQETVLQGELRLSDGQTQTGSLGVMALGTQDDDTIQAADYFKDGGDISAGNAQGSAVYGFSGDDTLAGSVGDDTLVGGDGDDELSGSVGSDQLNGGEGDDTLNGGSGHDQLVGGAGDDELVAGDGNNTLSGGAGDDTLTGGSGTDVLEVGKGNNTVDGGSSSAAPGIVDTTIDTVVLTGTRTDYNVTLITKSQTDATPIGWSFQNKLDNTVTTVRNTELARFENGGFMNLILSEKPTVLVINANGELTRFDSVEAALKNAGTSATVLLGKGNFDGFLLDMANKSAITLTGLGQLGDGSWLTTVKANAASALKGAIQLDQSSNSAVTIGGAGLGLQVIGGNGDGPNEASAIYIRRDVQESQLKVIGNRIDANGDSALLTEEGSTRISILTIEDNTIGGINHVAGLNARRPDDTPDRANFEPGNNFPRPLVYLGTPNKTGDDRIALLNFSRNTLIGKAGFTDTDPSPLNDEDAAVKVVQLFGDVVIAKDNLFRTEIPGQHGANRLVHLQVEADVLTPAQQLTLGRSEVSGNTVESVSGVPHVINGGLLTHGVAVYGNNRYKGSDSADRVLSMSDGNDIVFGGAGADTLNGSGGNDRIDFGVDTARDVLVFDLNNGMDTLVNFASANDKIGVTIAMDARLGVDLTTEFDPGFGDSNRLEVATGLARNTIDTRRDTQDTVRGLQKGAHGTVDVLVMADNAVSGAVQAGSSLSFESLQTEASRKLGNVSMDSGDKFLTLFNLTDAQGQKGFAVVEIEANRYLLKESIQFGAYENPADGNAQLTVLAVQYSGASSPLSGSHFIQLDI